MSLSKDQLKAREGRLTASRVACLMDGNKEKILNLWRELVGDPAFVPEDLSDVWPVRLGEVTEALNLEWFARKHGPISRQGEVVIHSNGWAAATLDAWYQARKCPVEVKHVGGFEKRDVVIQRYMPQVHWQMMVCGASECALSLIEGAREPSVEFIALDAAYSKELWQRAEAFMECVRTLTPPVELDPVELPVSVFVEYDFSTRNAWISAVGDWLANKEGAAKFEVAKDNIKELIPRDAKRVFGGGVEAVRDKANRIKIVESKSA